jgi:hypothetical protein
MTTCRECGGAMQKAVEQGSGVPFAAVALFLVGVALLFVFPAGTVIGVALIFAALVLGYPRKKVWTCANCGFEHV